MPAAALAPTAPAPATTRPAAPPSAPAPPASPPLPASHGGGPLLALRGLSFAYPGGRHALRGVSLELAPGEWALLCGENGSGKTTLSRLLLGLLRPPKGTVFLGGRDIARMKTAELAGSIGYVFQEPEHQFVTGSVLDEMLYGPLSCTGRRRGGGLPEAEIERAKRLLEAAGLSGKEHSSPYLLSGGEKRLLGAAAQFMTPKLLYILDEPTAGTDYAAASLLVNLCRQASVEGAALLVITHEPELFRHEADVIFTMQNGLLGEPERK
ncbi:energy-coupling factor ABC transporter ATP-binding protein [Paenibacillus caui]|uniref:energy-coupling factor ABC transporter ATP-binding protein n=1 Tax=Paenibacillus caui TaxID=2873927 RepID=UPI001F1B2A1D|nr:ABC transporter ATP-binding protein [Paenibacillus caui]